MLVIITFRFVWIKTDFHMKDFALRLLSVNKGLSKHGNDLIPEGHDLEVFKRKESEVQPRKKKNDKEKQALSKGQILPRRTDYNKTTMMESNIEWIILLVY